jgi:hypothetical protein
MNNQSAAERRNTEAVTKPIPQDIDRFEDEGGPAPADTRQQHPDDAPVVPMEVAQPEFPLPIACPKCGGEDIPTQEAAGAADPNQVIVTAGATAHSVQVHHRDIPELQSHGESPELAAANLVQDLAREIDVAADDLHREPLQQALDDVKASTEQSA